MSLVELTEGRLATFSPAKVARGPEVMAATVTGISGLTNKAEPSLASPTLFIPFIGGQRIGLVALVSTTCPAPK